MNASLQKSLGEKAKDLIPRLGKTLLQAGPVVGPALNLATGGVWGALMAGSMDFAKRFFSETDSIETIFKCLSEALERQGKRFLVLIDDIDRLTPNEAILIFRLVKSLGRLPNLMYLLVFDRELAEKAVAEIYPSEGPHFLEKIIQASFELPLPARDDLNRATLAQIGHICGIPQDTDGARRFMNIFYDAVAPYLNTPRDLVRLSNALSIGWPPIEKEVDVADYVALETMRLFENSLYTTVRTNKTRVTGLRDRYGMHEDPKNELDNFLKPVPEKRREHARLALMRLFPRFENVGYSNESMDRWEASRFVCSAKHFDTYFRMSVADETLSITEIDEFLRNAGDKPYVKDTFMKALRTIRKDGKSKVPLLFDELNVHAARIDKKNFPSLITGIFEISDDILRDEDRERGFQMGNNHLRIHWLIRKLTWERCTLEERSEMFMVACQTSQVGWLVDFTSSAVADYHPREGKPPEPPEKCLVTKDHLDELKAHTLKTIRTAAANGGLISHPLLLSILFRWSEIAENGSTEVKGWSNEQLKSDEAVSRLAQALLSESWSQGMGMFGLGDRVAIRKVKAAAEGIDRIIDVDEFRSRLEKIASSDSLDGERKQNVLTFLKCWKKQGVEDEDSD